MERPQSSARVLVIGGGIGGLSAAYHLASLGMPDVLLLERAELSSGTTWHSTGNMETYRADPMIFAMVRYAAEMYPRVARESGHDIGWRAVGRVMYTDREERWDLMRTLPELGRARGIDIELLSPAAVNRRLPIIAEDDLIGGVWVPSDARVNPTDAVAALARIGTSARCANQGALPGARHRVREGSVLRCDHQRWRDRLRRHCSRRRALVRRHHQVLRTSSCRCTRSNTST